MNEEQSNLISRRELIGKTTVTGLAALGIGALAAQTNAQEEKPNQPKNPVQNNNRIAANGLSAMYYEKITPQNSAVLLIDYQTQLLLGCQSMDQKKLVNNTVALARIAKMFNLPVVITTTGGGAKGPAGPTLPALTAEFPNVKQIDRQLFFNSMLDPQFVEAVQKTGRKKLIIGGITTDLCVVFPAVTAVGMGYDVFVVGDACASWDKQIDDLAMMRIAQAGAIPVNVQALAAELQSNLAEIDPAAAKANQQNLLKFYGEFVGVTGLINNSFFK